MISEKLQVKIKSKIQTLQKYTNRKWYPPFIGFLAALDFFILIVPTDGILISSTMITPKRWFAIAVCMAIGSTLGAIALAAIVQLQGLPWILDLYPGISETQTWQLSQKFFEQYGLILVFAVAASPFVQHPTVILASLANSSILELTAIIFVGRLLKFLLIAYLSSHAPSVLGKLWGLKGEMKEVGIKLKE